MQEEASGAKGQRASVNEGKQEEWERMRNEETEGWRWRETRKLRTFIFDNVFTDDVFLLSHRTICAPWTLNVFHSVLSPCFFSLPSKGSHQKQAFCTVWIYSSIKFSMDGLSLQPNTSKKSLEWASHFTQASFWDLTFIVCYQWSPLCKWEQTAVQFGSHFTHVAIKQR